MSIVFYRIKCKMCGYKFSLSSNFACNSCKYLGVKCTHKELCFKCFNENMKSMLFFGSATAIVLVALNGIGERLF